MTGNEPVVLVTGGSRRVGAAIVQRLHREGWRVAIHYRASQPEASALADQLNAMRPNSALTVAAELLEVAALAPLVAHVVEHFGRLDALVNNASTYYATPIGDIAMQDWEALMGSNLRAPLFLAQAAAPHLKASGGSIVNITDIHTERPMPDYVVYNVAKAGLRGLTHALARDLAPAVRVNAVAPGPIWTPLQPAFVPNEKIEHFGEQTPIGRAGQPVELAPAYVFLASQESSYVVGETIAVTGGMPVT